MQSAERHLRCVQALGLPPILFEKLPGSSSRYFERVATTTNNEINNDAANAGRTNTSAKSDDESSSSSGNYGQVTLVRPTAALLRRKNNHHHDVKRGGVYALKRYKAERLTPDEQLRIAIPLYLARQQQQPTAATPYLIRYVAAYEFEDDGTALLMDWVDGESLANIATLEAQYLHRVVNERRWACWMSDIAMALAHLHASGVVHRDVHAGNVLIRGAEDGAKGGGGGNKSAVLIDLDLACAPNECQYLCSSGPANNQTTAYDLWCRSGVQSATPAQWQAGDVFALGATFLRFAAAKQPLALATMLPLRTAARENADGCVAPLDFAVDAAVSRAVRTHIADPNLSRVMKAMLQSDWSKRPSAEQVVELLAEFRCDHPDTRTPLTLPKVASVLPIKQQTTDNNSKTGDNREEDDTSFSYQ